MGYVGTDIFTLIGMGKEWLISGIADVSRVVYMAGKGRATRGLDSEWGIWNVLKQTVAVDWDAPKIITLKLGISNSLILQVSIRHASQDESMQFQQSSRITCGVAQQTWPDFSQYV